MLNFLLYGGFYCYAFLSQTCSAFTELLMYKKTSRNNGADLRCRYWAGSWTHSLVERLTPTCQPHRTLVRIWNLSKITAYHGNQSHLHMVKLRRLN